MVQLSRLENHILALVRKWQPATAYFIRKSLRDTLATNISDSPGSVYPAIERLKANGLLLATPATRGKQSSEHLSCSQAGDTAIREWLTLVSTAESLPEDAWRTKIRFADMLSESDLKAWLGELRNVVRSTSDRLDRIQPVDGDTLHELEIEQARLYNAARMAWINAAVASLLK